MEELTKGSELLRNFKRNMQLEEKKVNADVGKDIKVKVNGHSKPSSRATTSNIKDKTSSSQRSSSRLSISNIKDKSHRKSENERQPIRKTTTSIKENTKNHSITMGSVIEKNESPSHQSSGKDSINESLQRNSEIENIANNEKGPSNEYYEKGQKYWSEIPATVNGMLGGFGYISNVDIKGSSMFLRNFDLKHKRALDCGAGIGRISKDLLFPRFLKVDMVEQDSNFAARAREFCSQLPNNRLGEIFNMGLQDFTPQPDTYDLVWSQWVLGYLTDEDLLEFFKRIRQGLHVGGYFVIKDNVTSSNEIDIDETDSSVTRPLQDYERLLKAADLVVVKIERQMNLPHGLYPVYMIASKRLD